MSRVEARLGILRIEGCLNRALCGVLLVAPECDSEGEESAVARIPRHVPKTVSGTT